MRLRTGAACSVQRCHESLISCRVQSNARGRSLSVFSEKLLSKTMAAFFSASLSMNQTANRRLNSKGSPYFIPSTHTLEKFIARVEQNAHAEAIKEFYTEGASMRENKGVPRVGRDALVANVRKVIARSGR